MSAAEDRAQLLELIRRVSVEKKRVVLSSGIESDLYIDLRQTLMRPLGMRLGGRVTYEKLRSGPAVDAVGGMAVGAVPYVAAVLAAAAEHDPATKLLGFFVRKEVKQHGLGRLIEGGFEPGQTVALLEDTTTTGGSTLQALETVREAGGKVARVLCLVDRGEGAREAFAQRGVELEPIFTREDLGV